MHSIATGKIARRASQNTDGETPVFVETFVRSRRLAAATKTNPSQTNDTGHVNAAEKPKATDCSRRDGRGVSTGAA
jgi:hypothetical protein